ncbi:MAG: protein translocase subunit SecD [Caulobacteraceae bacterium]|nr:protein translocase subunit SecD [Caulobacteraceae bacterium]
MLPLPRWRVVLCVLAVLFGLVFTAPNLIPQKTLDGLPSWLPHQKVNLGLDLQGGSYLLLEVDTDALRKERLTNLVEDVRTALREKSIVFSGLGQANGGVTVRITDVAQMNNALQALRQLGQQVAGGGRDVDVGTAPDQRIQLSLQPQAITEDAAKAVAGDIEILRRRIDPKGTKEVAITRQGLDRIVVEVPGESDPEHLKALIGQTAKLSFQMVDETVTNQDIADGRIPPEDVVMASGDGYAPAYAVNRRAVVTGEMLTNASQEFDPQTGAPVVGFRFNGQGAHRFGDATSENVGKRFAIVLDDKILSAPRINGAILGGSGVITGNFTASSANDLALLLRSGALPAPLKVQEQRTVGAELGSDSVRAGALAGIIAVLLIGAFMGLAYGFVFGGIAIVGLLLNMAMLLAAMSVGGAVLTLPGIAGLILTIAMAVDANVLIYERIRDEERAGRRPAVAIDTGFTRATVSILDANLTTGISALILFMFGAGPVRGFAWTLSIGIVTSVFTALFITRLFVFLWFRSSRAKKLPI